MDEHSLGFFCQERENRCISQMTVEGRSHFLALGKCKKRGKTPTCCWSFLYYKISWKMYLWPSLVNAKNDALLMISSSEDGRKNSFSWLAYSYVYSTLVRTTLYATKLSRCTGCPISILTPNIPTNYFHDTFFYCVKLTWNSAKRIEN